MWAEKLSIYTYMDYGVSDVNVKSEHKEMSPKRERKKGALKGSVKRERKKGA